MIPPYFAPHSRAEPQQLIKSQRDNGRTRSAFRRQLRESFTHPAHCLAPNGNSLVSHGDATYSRQSLYKQLFYHQNLRLSIANRENFDKMGDVDVELLQYPPPRSRSEHIECSTHIKPKSGISTAAGEYRISNDWVVPHEKPRGKGNKRSYSDTAAYCSPTLFLYSVGRTPYCSLKAVEKRLWLS